MTVFLNRGAGLVLVLPWVLLLFDGQAMSARTRMTPVVTMIPLIAIPISAHGLLEISPFLLSRRVFIRSQIGLVASNQSVASGFFSYHLGRTLISLSGWWLLNQNIHGLSRSQVCTLIHLPPSAPRVFGAIPLSILIPLLSSRYLP